MLDCNVAEECNDASNSFSVYLKARANVKSLQEQQSILRSEINQAQQILAMLLLTVSNPTQDNSVQQVAQFIQYQSTMMTTNVSLLIKIG